VPAPHRIRQRCRSDREAGNAIWSPVTGSAFAQTYQRVRFTQLVDPRCPGLSRIRVGFVTTVGAAGNTPVPGLPGQSAEVPVG
jgi:hypothetical protein